MRSRVIPYRLGNIVCVILLAGLTLSAYTSGPIQTNTPQPDAELAGRVLLWHDWQEFEAPILQEMLARFQTAHPGIEVISLPIGGDSPLATLQDRFAKGLGPDLLLIDSDLIGDLAQLGLVQGLGSRADVDRKLYLASALSTVGDGEKLYGLPFTVSTELLYYNKELVERPATTVDGLMADAAAGKTVALNAGLADAFWGTRAFGGRLLGRDGKITLQQGGFTNWLDYLRSADAVPGVQVDDDVDRLRTAFVEGRAAYYVGGADELRILAGNLGEERLGVAMLPSGMGGPASPLLEVDALAVSTAASPEDTELAMELAAHAGGYKPHG